MPISHGKTTRVWIGGYPLSGVFDSAELQTMNDLGETTVFDAASKTYIAGLEDATMGFQGLFVSGAGTGNAALEDLLDGDPVATVLVGGDTPITGQAIATGLTTTTPFSNVVRQSFDLQMARHTVGASRPVLVAGDLLYEGTTTPATDDGPSVDFGAHTTGLAFVFHLQRAGSGGRLRVLTSSTANFATSAQLATHPVGADANYAAILTTTSSAQRYLRAQWAGVNVGNRVLMAAYRL